LAHAETAGDGPVFDRLSALARETGVVVCAGFVEKAERLHLAHYAVFPDGDFVAQRKHRVTRSEAPLSPAFEQDPPFAFDGTGTPTHLEFRPFTVKSVRCALTICADAGIENLESVLDGLQVDLKLLPTGAGGERKDRVTTAELATPEGLEKFVQMSEAVFWPGAASRECLVNRRSQAAVNLIGYDGRRHYHLGHGSIVNALGEVVGFFPGIVNLDRQKPCYGSAWIDADEKLASD